MIYLPIKTLLMFLNEKKKKLLSTVTLDFIFKILCII